MCDCNDSQFKKLRDNWSRYTKGSQPCQCCQVPKAKTKGKFGVAYVIETPNRKCKPCGWEIEFTDTPSTIENNCKKIMNWITCPPLGECQNANTTVCCCSPPAKGVCTLNQACCPPKNGDDSVLIGSDDLTIKTNETSGEIPGVRKRLKKGLGKKLLEQIHKKHREEMEAIHHLEPPKNELNQEKPTESLNEYYFSAQNDLNKVESNVIYPE